MPPSIKQFLQQLPPFILIGISIALGVGIFIVFSYVLIWGILIGAILWGVNLLVQYFKPSSTIPNKNNANKTSSGRIIDHDQN